MQLIFPPPAKLIALVVGPASSIKEDIVNGCPIILTVDTLESNGKHLWIMLATMTADLVYRNIGTYNATSEKCNGRYSIDKPGNDAV